MALFSIEFSLKKMQLPNANLRLIKVLIPSLKPLSFLSFFGVMRFLLIAYIRIQLAEDGPFGAPSEKLLLMFIYLVLPFFTVFRLAFGKVLLGVELSFSFNSFDDLTFLVVIFFSFMSVLISLLIIS